MFKRSNTREATQRYIRDGEQSAVRRKRQVDGARLPVDDGVERVVQLLRNVARQRGAPNRRDGLHVPDTNVPAHTNTNEKMEWTARDTSHLGRLRRVHRERETDQIILQGRAINKIDETQDKRLTNSSVTLSKNTIQSQDYMLQVLSKLYKYIILNTEHVLYCTVEYMYSICSSAVMCLAIESPTATHVPA